MQVIVFQFSFLLAGLYESYTIKQIYKIYKIYKEEERPVRVDNSRVNSRWKKIIVDNSRAMRAPFTFPLATYDSLK